MENLTRREILKLLSAAPLPFAAPYFVGLPAEKNRDASAKNIFIIVFDTLSAAHISLYGYPRHTMPNLARFAQRATVYHNHYASGIFTTPGTASLLNGLHAWTHRAIRYDDKVAKPYQDKHLFSLFDHYHRIAYSHNSLVNTLFLQFNPYLDVFLPREELFLTSFWLDNVFPRDYDTASLSWVQYITQELDRVTGSLYLSGLYQKTRSHALEAYEEIFPRGIPTTPVGDIYFVLEHAIDWAQERLESMPRPFLFYLHLLPPHNPYKTRQEFINLFKDKWKPVKKPESIFTGRHLQTRINDTRQKYDEYLLYVDAEFGRFYDWMLEAGILEDTWLLFTSDHGEMFERGILFHEKPVIYQPVVHIPLLISAPGQQMRQDVYTPTSAIDVLPTLLQQNGMPIPNWVEGQVLPPYNSQQSERPVFSLEARGNQPNHPLTKATAMNIRWPYKLLRYWGHNVLPAGATLYEMFDLENDSEELIDLYSPQDPVSKALQEELLSNLEAADTPYR